MFADAIERVSSAFFPIFWEHHIGNRMSVGISGTGFFISSTGYFITAEHVINGIPKGAQIIYGGNIPDSVLPQPLTIQEIFRDAESDIFIGQINIQNQPYFTISEECPRIGTSICLCGYPLAQMSSHQDGIIDVNAVRKYYQPTFVIDYFTSVDEGRTHDGFMTQHTSLNGMSGGPVFGVDGQALGMDVATFGRQILIPNGLQMMINNGIVQGVSSLRQAIQKSGLRI